MSLTRKQRKQIEDKIKMIKCKKCGAIINTKLIKIVEI